MPPTKTNFWKFLTKLTEQFFGFLKSRVVILAVILAALYFGIVNLETLQSFVDAVKGLFG